MKGGTEMKRRSVNHRAERAKGASARYYFYLTEHFTRLYKRVNGFIPDVSIFLVGKPLWPQAAAIRAGWEIARMKIEDPLWWEAGLAR
jgi:endonuclease I